MKTTSFWCAVLMTTLSLGVGACGRAAGGPNPATPETQTAQTAPTGGGGPAYGGAPASMVQEAGNASPAPPSTPVASGAQKSSSAADMAPAGPPRGEMARSRSPEPPPEARPGLGTAWGETRQSATTTAPFLRDDGNRPFGTATIWYNDREGANAMARASDYRNIDRSVVPVLGGALTVSVRGENGYVLPGFMGGGRQYVVGEPGQRYTILVQNNTNYRFECVASVDGLDVIDGRPADFTKRGYLVAPYGTLEIDGFRQSADAVAAFRFSSVRGSYSARSGQGDRNVGVVGVAFFNERGTNPTWTQEEINRRHNADPFPGRYATPPSQ